MTTKYLEFRNSYLFVHVQFKQQAVCLLNFVYTFTSHLRSQIENPSTPFQFNNPTIVIIVSTLQTNKCTIVKLSYILNNFMIVLEYENILHETGKVFSLKVFIELLYKTLTKLKKRYYSII